MSTAQHEITLVWHDLRPRLLSVARVTRLTPGMVRITLTGDDFEGFRYAAPDDHMKIFFPLPGERLPVMPTLGPEGLEPPPPGAPRPTFRDYTARYVRPESGEVDIDFALHGHGPGGTWAAGARPGDLVGVLGPRASYLNPLDFDWYLFAGDETALPAIGAWLERLPAGVKAFALLEVGGPEEEQAITSAADLSLVWLHRNGSPAGTTDVLERAVRGTDLPTGDGYVWIAGEAGTLKPIRRHLRSLGLPKDWVEVDGYWKRGVVNLDHHDDDDA